MRKITAPLCVFTFILAFFSIFFIQNPVSAAVKVHIVKDDATEDAIIDYLKSHWENQELPNSQQNSEQRNNETALQTKQIGDYTDAAALNNVAMEHQKSMNETHKTWMNMPDAVCVYPSMAQSVNSAITSAKKAAEVSMEQMLKVINAEAGTPAANGRIDYNNKLFQEATGLCSPTGNGGANAFCGGDGTNDHINAGKMLITKNISESGDLAAKFGYLQKVLFGRIFSNINPDLLQSPSTEIKNIVIEQDNLKAEMSIGSAAFHLVKSYRTPNKGSGAGIQSLKEIMSANQWASETQQKLLPSNASFMGQLEAMTRGVFGSKHIMAEMTKNERNTLSGILFAMMVNNLLLFQQLEMLESIALSTGATVVANGTERYEALERRIRAQNARQ